MTQDNQNRAPFFTEDQLRMFKDYERVRAGGQYNMFDSRARIATGLSQDQYFFVIDNFEALEAQVNANAKAAS